MRRAVQLLVPGGFVVAAVAAVLITGAAGPSARWTGTYGWIVFGAGLVLSWLFHRSRVFVVLLGLLVVDRLLTAGGPHGAEAQAGGALLLALTGAIGVLRDRGLSSRGGALQLGVGGAGVAAGVVLLRTETWRDILLGPAQSPFGLPIPTEIPTATLAALCVALGGLGFGCWRRRGPVDRGLVWAGVLIGAPLLLSIPLEEWRLLYVAAGLVLTLSLIETSYVLAYRDDLTGLPARRALNQYLDGLGGTYTIAMVDVDHFKRFNDKHGHDVGDQVLRLVAARLAKAPGGAKAYRYGGEEFTLLFPGRVSEDAIPHLEEVRKKIKGSPFELRSWRRPRAKPRNGRARSKPRGRSGRGGQPLSVSVSIGVADSDGVGTGPEAVLERADQALYRAKKQGRNRVSA